MRSTSRLRRATTGVGSLVTLIVLAVGVPFALSRLAGWPLPSARSIASRHHARPVAQRDLGLDTDQGTRSRGVVRLGADRRIDPGRVDRVGTRNCGAAAAIRRDRAARDVQADRVGRVARQQRPRPERGTPRDREAAGSSGHASRLGGDAGSVPLACGHARARERNQLEPPQRRRPTPSCATTLSGDSRRNTSATRCVGARSSSSTSERASPTAARSRIRNSSFRAGC